MARDPANMEIPNDNSPLWLFSPLQIPSNSFSPSSEMHFLEKERAGSTGRGSSVFTGKSELFFPVAGGNFPSAHFCLRDKPLALLVIVSHEISCHFRAPLRVSK